MSERKVWVDVDGAGDLCVWRETQCLRPDEVGRLVAGKIRLYLDVEHAPDDLRAIADAVDRHLGRPAGGRRG